ncbi:MAG: hypothetical protein ACRCY8_19675 [Dermatophilaceae bacterium]
MVKRSIQGYVELASGVGELTRSKAVEAAHELLALAGSDASRKKAAKQAGKLADDLLSAAEQNRRQVVSLVQREVDAALGRVDLARVLAEVQALGASVAGLAAQVDELARGVATRPTRPAAPTPRSPAVDDDASVAEPVTATRVDDAVSRGSNASSPGRPVNKASGKAASGATKAPAKAASTARSAPAKKASGKAASGATKAPAKAASTARSAPAKKASGKAASGATKAPAKTATKAASTAKKTAAMSGAGKAPAKAASTARKAPAKTATTTPTRTARAANRPTTTESSSGTPRSGS